MPAKGDNITVRLVADADGVDADAFVFALEKTIELLKELNKQSSDHGVETIRWRIVAAGMNSPMFATLAGEKIVGRSDDNSEAITNAAVTGLGQLERVDVCPHMFNGKSLKIAAQLSKVYTRAGIQRLEFENSKITVVASTTLSQNANTAIHRLSLTNAKKSLEYVETGTIEGVLTDLSGQAERDKIVVVDELTNRKTPCFFRGESQLDEQVRESWKHRVAVTGDITFDSFTHEPIEVRVHSIRELRDSSALPQIDDLRGINLTGNVDPADYIRSLRDGE
jgi:hypothetical protein